MKTDFTQEKTHKYKIGDLVFVIAKYQKYSNYTGYYTGFKDTIDLTPTDLELDDECDIFHSKVYMFEVEGIRISRGNIIYSLICQSELQEIDCDEEYIYETEKEAVFAWEVKRNKLRIKSFFCCCCNCKCKK
jgi:hypothetical protein